MENNEKEFLVCPFCGQEDIKYGASVCRGCQAENIMVKNGLAYF